MQMLTRWQSSVEEENLNPLVAILQKPDNTRTTDEISELIEYTKDINFFREIIYEYNEKVHEEICQVMSYKFFSEGEIIFRQGSLGDNFFIIISGQVGVWIKHYTICQEKLHRRRNIFQQQARQSALSTEAVTLVAGQSFGEQALIEGGKMKKRAATIVCKTDCHLAVLNRKQFDQVLKDIKEKKQGREMNYMMSIPLFQELDYKYVRRNIFLHFYPQQYERNQVIYKQGDPAEKFYLIKKGEVKICKRINLLNGSDKFCSHLQHYYSGTKGTYSKLQEITLLIEKEFFGFYEIMQNTTRQFTIICKSTEATILEMSASNFVSNILQSAQCKQFLSMQILEQNKQHEKLLTSVIRNSNNFSTSSAKQFVLNNQPKLHSSLTFNEQDKQLKDIPEEFVSIKNYNRLENPSIPKKKILREVLLNFSQITNISQNKSQENSLLKLKRCTNVFERSYNYASPASYVTQFKVNYQKQSSLQNKEMKQLKQFYSSRQFEKHKMQFNQLKQQLDSNLLSRKISKQIEKRVNLSTKDSKQASMSDAQTTQTDLSPKHLQNFNIYNQLYCQNMKNLKNQIEKKTLAKIFYAPTEKKLNTRINLRNYSVLVQKLQNQMQKLN